MLDNVKDILNDFRQAVIKDARKNLTKKNASGNLSKNITSELEVYRSGNFRLAFDLGKYGEFVDKGVKGADPKRVKGGKQKAPKSPYSFKASKKSIPTKVLDKWIVRRGIAPRDKDGKFKSGRKSLSFLIARSIHAQGLKPSLFFTKAFNKNYKKLNKDLVEAFGLDVEEFLKYTLNNLK